MSFVKRTLWLLLLTAGLLGAREQVDINFSNLQISDLIKLVGKIENTNILVNYRIDGTVNLVTSTPIYDDEILTILISVLESKGYTLVRNGSVMEVVRSADAAKGNLEVLKTGNRAGGALMLTQAISVKGEDVDVVAAKIRYLISKNAKLMTMKETNMMLLTDFPQNVETVKKVIEAIDTKSRPMMKIVTLEHAELKKLQAQVTEIAKNLFNQKVEREKVAIIANEELNAFIFIGKETNIDTLTEIVADLDQEQTAIEESVQIIHLKNSDVATVLQSLNTIISSQTFPDPTLKPSISANEELNALIMVGHPSSLRGVIAIIEELDKEKYQVYVQARIVEINHRDSEAIGLKYGLDAGMATPSGLYTLAGNFGGSSALSSPITAAMSGITDSLGNLEQGLALGASLDFLQSKGASKTVSNPSILCVNNKESSIYVGKTISIQTGSAISTGSVQSNSYKREDVGLTLKIKPRVSSDDKVTLDVEGILENAVDIDDNGQPVTTKQTVTTQSILRHGESIIIGGLVKSYNTESETKLPFLGHIPLLGELFTSTNTEEQQDSLLVILTPYVIGKSEQLSKLQEQLGELERLQNEYNEAVFPTIEEKAKTGEADAKG